MRVASPRLCLPPLPVVIWPEPSGLGDQGRRDNQDVRGGPH
ncbi:hypothetical protein ABT147_44545 [Streptomyces sp. NPDC001868]